MRVVRYGVTHVDCGVFEVVFWLRRCESWLSVHRQNYRPGVRLKRIVQDRPIGRSLIDV